MFDIVENKRLCDSNFNFINLPNDFDKIVYSYYEFENSMHNIKFIDHSYKVNNECYVSVDYLREFIENSDYKYKDEVNKLLEEYNSIYENIKNIDIEDYITKRGNIISQYDSIFLSLSDYFEDYFIKNMPNEYKEKILDKYDRDIKI